jgi:hypothetical protein
MRDFIVAMLRRGGADRAVLFSVSGRLATAVMSPITLLLLGTSLTAAEQGFYFTFNSIIALQVVVELGLAVVILQFASHEMAHLRWVGRRVEGDEGARWRLASLVRFALVWYGTVSIILVGIVLPLGALFLGRGGSTVQWQTPWQWVVAASAALLLLTPLLSVLEGTGKVANVAMIRAAQDIIATLALWAALRLGLRLNAAAIFVAVRVLVTGTCLAIGYAGFFVSILRQTKGIRGISWLHEIWPFQWRIAVSWLSGYFIFQLFTPMIFAFRGAVEAGRVGMSIAVASAITTTGLTWVSTKAAPFGTLIASRRFDALDEAFFRAARISAAVTALGLLVVWCTVAVAGSLGLPIAARFVGLLPLALFFATALINQIIGAQAVYLRAHKEEPFLVLSLAAGILVAGLSYIAGHSYGAYGIAVAYFVVMLAIAYWSTSIFVQRRRLWHEVSVD